MHAHAAVSTAIQWACTLQFMCAQDPKYKAITESHEGEIAFAKEASVPWDCRGPLPAEPHKVGGQKFRDNKWRPGSQRSDE